MDTSYIMLQDLSENLCLIWKKLDYLFINVFLILFTLYLPFPPLFNGLLYRKGYDTNNLWIRWCSSQTRIGRKFHAVISCTASQCFPTISIPVFSSHNPTFISYPTINAITTTKLITDVNGSQSEIIIVNKIYSQNISSHWHWQQLSIL